MSGLCLKEKKPHIDDFSGTVFFLTQSLWATFTFKWVFAKQSTVNI